MASQNGYEGATSPVTGFFTKEQRARLEALTFARKLTNHNELDRGRPGVRDWLALAEYIVNGVD